jgi:hypothetical protein
MYSFFSMGLFLIGAPAGIWHHNFIIIIPAFFMLVFTSEMPRVRKKLRLRDRELNE